MSAAAEGSATTAKAVAADNDGNGKPLKDQQKPKTLEEDDEFEDFPVEDWPQEDTELPSGNTHLWEESWDDDDTSDDFSQQLKEELKKVDAGKRSS